MQKGFDTPWKLGNQFHRWLLYPWNRLLFFFNGISWGPGWRLYGIPVIQKHRDSQMSFGTGLQLRSTVRSNPLGANHSVILCTWRAGAVLQVGENFAMTGGGLIAAEKVSIGDNVNVGANTTIMDTDFHPLDAQARRLDSLPLNTAPVLLEDDVFLGMNCLVLKGVTIGRGSVVGAGSVVTKDVPPGVIVAGNPAHTVGNVQ